MTAVRYTVEDGIAVLDFGNPPVNALSHALRRELAAMRRLRSWQMRRRLPRCGVS